MSAVVTPQLDAGQWLYSQGGYFPFTANVATITYAFGATIPDPCLSPALVAIVEVYLNQPPATVSATFAGLPCLTNWVGIDSGTIYGDTRFTIIAVCPISPSDTLVGADLVITFDAGITYGTGLDAFMGFATNVDPSTTLTTLMSDNNSGVLDPAQFTQMFPAVLGNAGDMIISTIRTEISSPSWHFEPSSSPTFTYEYYQTSSEGIPVSVARRQLTTTESDAVTWTTSTADTETGQYSYGASFVLTALAPPCDPHFADVGLLLHCDGADHSTTFVDSSLYANTMTQYGTAEISTADPAFGTGAWNNSADDYNHAAAVFTPVTVGGPLDLSTGDFTVEGRFKLSNFVNLQQIIIDITDIGLSTDWTQGGPQVSGFRIYAGQSGSGYEIYAQAFGPAAMISFGSPVCSIDALWHHFGFVRYGDAFDLFLDGVCSGDTLTQSGPMGTATWCTLACTPYYGPAQDTNWAGQLDEIRITKGVARYLPGVNFTSPAVAPPGPCVSTMPYIIGDTASEANGVIIAAGFITGAVDQTPNPAPAGTVIYQYPLAGSMPDPGSPVNYTLSMGIGGGSAYGKFVGSWVGKAIELTNIGDIEPKVWRPIHVQTARSRS